MPRTKTKTAASAPQAPPARRAAELLAELKRLGSARIRDEMQPRYGITAAKAFGVSVANLQKIAKRYGRDHDFAAELWETGWYEARLLAALVDEPERVTPAQMDRWCRDFDNWGICDSACFWLFDRTPHAAAMIKKWSARKPEYERRAAFALLASMALHRKDLPDSAFADGLALAEQAASDDRNFVKKAVSWALRSVGRRSPELNRSASAAAERMLASGDRTAAWIARDVLRDLSKKKNIKPR